MAARTLREEPPDALLAMLEAWGSTIRGDSIRGGLASPTIPKFSEIPMTA